MRLNSNEKINNLRISAVRDALRYISEDSLWKKPTPFDTECLGALLKIDEKELKSLCKELVNRNVFTKEGNGYFLSRTGNSFLTAKTDKQLISRKRAQIILDELLARVDDINTGRVSSVNKIPVVILFGSMLTDTPEVSDVDVVITHPSNKDLTRDLYIDSAMEVLYFKKHLLNEEIHNASPESIADLHEIWFKAYLNFSPYISTHHLLEISLFKMKNKNFPYKILIGNEDTVLQQYLEIIELYQERGNISEREREIYFLKNPWFPVQM
jgi:predicted nucleotidyltransferase